MTTARKRLAELFLIATEGRPFLRDITFLYEVIGGQSSFCGLFTNPHFRGAPPERRPLRIAASDLLMEVLSPKVFSGEHDHEINVRLALDSKAADGVAITITRHYVRSLWDTRSV